MRTAGSPSPVARVIGSAAGSAAGSSAFRASG
jgi:hypothetical protein